MDAEKARIDGAGEMKRQCGVSPVSRTCRSCMSIEYLHIPRAIHPSGMVGSADMQPKSYVHGERRLDYIQKKGARKPPMRPHDNSPLTHTTNDKYVKLHISTYTMQSSSPPSLLQSESASTAATHRASSLLFDCGSSHVPYCSLSSASPDQCTLRCSPMDFI